ncbi:MAG: RNB domain-containing ribonuclease, partial [Ottowia sp.]|nr:RNB domain-containing ribonuclease [Ottowia sp.]
MTTNVLFDEAGRFLAGRILSETEASAQVELPAGRRVKVKAAAQVLRFASPEPAALLEQAQQQAADVDLPLAWEAAPEGEFGFAQVAADYFGATPGVVQQAAMLLALHGAPHYFRRAGKGRFKKAPADIVAQALAAIEKRKKIAAQVDAWATELAAGNAPEEVRAQLFQILFRPDKNAPEYKAVVQASRATSLAPLALLQRAGAIGAAYEFHWQRFLFEHFPQGEGFPPLPPLRDDFSDVPLAPEPAFSVDDSQTTEIDDAISLQGLGSGRVTLGIHIAAPALAMTPEDGFGKLARQRLSTVYMPGWKVTMLPPDAVQALTLEEGRATPALSLYVDVDEGTLEVANPRTSIERVQVAANLRLEHLAGVDEGWLRGEAAEPPISEENGLARVPQVREKLAFLWRLAQHLKAGRERVRGRAEQFRADYSFRLDKPSDTPPTGAETVSITQRTRGAVLDTVVSELMILANTTWGQWLDAQGVAAIYRSQASLAPGVKVRMGTKARAHAGMGVPCYAWATSPLRRYVDLLNQWQLIACVRGDKPPFAPKDTALMAAVSAFDSAYTAYAAHQAAMERFWTLRWLRQEGCTELDATLLRAQGAGVWLARAQTLPLVFTALGAADAAPGAQVRVKLGEP